MNTPDSTPSRGRLEESARPLLLLDAMMPRAVANGLPPAAGVVMAADRPALRTGSDVLLFAAALEEELAVVTRNVGDFRVLAQQAQGAGSPCPAVILVTARRFPEGPGSVGPITTALRRLCADGIEAGRIYWLK